MVQNFQNYSTPCSHYISKSTTPLTRNSEQSLSELPPDTIIQSASGTKLQILNSDIILPELSYIYVYDRKIFKPKSCTDFCVIRHIFFGNHTLKNRVFLCQKPVTMCIVKWKIGYITENYQNQSFVYFSFICNYVLEIRAFSWFSTGNFVYCEETFSVLWSNKNKSLCNHVKY